jgi:hypothetical protein
MYSYHNKNDHFTLDDLLTFVKQELEFKNSQRHCTQYIGKWNTNIQNVIIDGYCQKDHTLKL